jgi:hypothetical protein
MRARSRVTDSPTSDQPTKTCAKCGQAKPLLAYAGRQNTCVACREAAKARTQERKDSVAWSPELGERITDALAAGSTLAEIAGQSWAPTMRQLRAFRRANPGFDQACEEALQASASAHIDAAKQVLRDIEASKAPADAKLLFEGHMRLAGTLNPKRFGSNPTIDITSAGRPIVDLTAVLEAAFAALPALPKPIDVEAEEVPPDRTLQ